MVTGMASEHKMLHQLEIISGQLAHPGSRGKGLLKSSRWL